MRNSRKRGLIGTWKLFLAAVLGGLLFVPSADIFADTKVIVLAGQVASEDLTTSDETESIPAYLVQIENDPGRRGKFKLALLVNRNDMEMDGVYGDVLGGDLTYAVSKGALDFGLGGGFGIVQTAGIEEAGFDADVTAYVWQAVATFDAYFSPARESGFRFRLSRFDAIEQDIDGIQATAGFIFPGIK